MWKIRLPKISTQKIFSRFHYPVLTAAEKSALGILLALLASGAALRAWERSGVAMGPVEDWDSLRRLVIRAPKPQGNYPCSEEPLAEFREAGFKKVSRKKGGKSGKKTGPSRPVDLNIANEAQLNALPGVGPSTAKAILAYRAMHGKFSAPEELMNVKGIGPKKFESMKDFVKVAGSNPAPTSPVLSDPGDSAP
jgi:comEA protein